MLTPFRIALLGQPIAATSRVKAWNGSSWVARDVKVWNGSTWAVETLKFWNGSTWS